MKKRHIIATLLAVVFAGAVPARAYNSGSTGALGAYVANGTNNTIPLPPNGVLHYTSFSVPAGQTVRFTRNADNTPVYLLATGNVDIAGVLDVSGDLGSTANAWTVTSLGGIGGPGGSEGGSFRYIASAGNFEGQAGLGPGGGGGDNVSTDVTAISNYGGGASATRNGSITAPGEGAGNDTVTTAIAQRDWWVLHGGSGGGTRPRTQSASGGQFFTSTGGGGVITIASSGTVTINGSIRATAHRTNTWAASNYFAAFAGCGGGGYVRVAASNVAGSGRILATSANLDLGFPAGHNTSYGTDARYGRCGALATPLSPNTWPNGGGVPGGDGVIRVEADNPVLGAFVTNSAPVIDFVIGNPERPLPFAEGAEPIIRVKSIGGAIVTPDGQHAMLNPKAVVPAGSSMDIVVETVNIPLSAQVYVLVNVVGQVAQTKITAPALTDVGGGVGNVTVSYTVPASARVGSVQAYVDQVPVP